MINFAVRNLKVFFKDKSAVFFSLLSVIIVFALYALFLGDVWVSGYEGITGARYMLDSWVCAGLLGITSVTATMGAFGIMVDDRAKKIYKDFYVSPMKRYETVAGYLLNAVIIGIIMSVITFILSEIYIVAYGGEIAGATVMLKVAGLIVLSTLTNVSIVFFIVSFIKSANAFSTVSIILGTLIGFLTGVYLPIGMLPESVQYIVKLFPPSYSSALFREVLMEKPLGESFAGIPAENLTDTEEFLGVYYKFGDYRVTAGVSIAVLLVVAFVFYGLAILNLSRKKK
jgi:multidrug/hemolysin transport system permease protein